MRSPVRLFKRLLHYSTSAIALTSDLHPLDVNIYDAKDTASSTSSGGYDLRLSRVDESCSLGLCCPKVIS